MGTLRGFPNPPALWLRRAKPGYANAIMGTVGGFPNPRPLPATHHPARCARPRALWRRREGRARRARGGGRGGVGPEAPTKSVGKARLRQRDHGNRGRVPKPSAPTRHPPPRSLRSASRALAEARGARAKGARGRAWRCRSRSTDEVGGQSPATPTRSWEPWEGSQTLGPYPPPTTPLAALGLARSGGGARGAREGREGEGVEV